MNHPRHFTTRPRGGTLLLAAILAGSLAACGGDDAGPAAVAVSHPWIHAPTAEDQGAVVLPPFLVYRVSAERRAEAVQELAQEPYVQISPGMASHFTGSEVQVPAEMRPFLIRGLTAGKSEITVVQSLHGLWVKVTGSDLAHLEQQPLVVLVDPTPNDIFVTVEPRRAPAAAP
ncbi:MAG: hypothetical protein K2Y51_25490 [Gammaproteobacteria bacterium]|nr:hypothetical protein [Gammaproteobacteria bacterium]